MSRAVLSLVLLLLLAAVPAASATRASGEITHCRNFPGRVGDASLKDARPRDLELSVNYLLEATATGPQVRWILSLRNRTSRALHVTFGDSQYANVVLRQGGEIVYSWDSQAVFAQVISGRRLGARATYVCSLGPHPLDLEPGRYELIAYLPTFARWPGPYPVRTRRSLLLRG